jgi:molecular chaperone GrpE
MAERTTPSPEAAAPEPPAVASAGDGQARELQERLQAVEEERDKFRDLYQRARADFDNYQKRSQRDQAQERRFAHGGLALDLLPVIDNFDRATAAAKQAGETGPLVQGVAMVQAQLLDLLRRHGITPIEAVGRPFDPNLHQAVMQQPTAEQLPGTVLQVLEKGFMIHDRVLRPARVVVAAAPASEGRR